MAYFNNLSYLHQIGKDPLRALTMGNLLEITAKKYPEREAIVALQQNQRLTYKEVLEMADRLAASLHIIGLQKGERFGVWAPNMLEWYIANMASVRGGFLMVALNPCQQAPELEYCINKVGIKTILCPYKGKYQQFYDILSEVVPELKTSKPDELICAKVPSLKGVIMVSETELPGTYNYYKILKLADEESIQKIKNSQHLIKPDDPCYIQFSSGTTGLPKAAVASHFHVVNNSYETGKRNELNVKHHRVCVQVPFFHVCGTTIAIAASINFGSTLVIPSISYNPRENLRALKEEKCTTMYGTPTMYIDLVEMQKRYKEPIVAETAVTGGAPCPIELFKQMKEVLHLKKVKSVYGMTETGPITFNSLPTDEDETKITSTVGHISDHWEAKIIDEDGNTVPFGIPGELCVRGYSTTLGYWGDEEKTKQMIGLDGWLKTGDQFVLQKDGYGRIVGRLKDMIIRGGENIYPKEIEDVISKHPAILEAQVIGLPDERLGEKVCACVRLKNGVNLTLEDLSNFLTGKIAFSKIPVQLEIVDGFPKTSSGKIQKYQLRNQIVGKGNNSK